MLAAGHLVCIMLSYIASIPLHLCFLQGFFHERVLDCQGPFPQLLKWSCDFCPWVFLCGVLHLLICVCWTSRHLFNETSSIEMNNSFHMVLKSVCRNFMENVCVYTFTIFFWYSHVFTWFWYEVNTSFIKWLWKYFFLFYFRESLEKTYCSTLKAWWSSTLNLSEPGLLGLVHFSPIYIPYLSYT